MAKWLRDYSYISLLNMDFHLYFTLLKDTAPEWELVYIMYLQYVTECSYDTAERILIIFENVGGSDIRCVSQMWSVQN